MTVERFWQRVKILGPDDCWLWTGAVTVIDLEGRGGYGMANIDGITRMTHRHVFQLTHGYLRAEKNICHSCDVRLCCNPKHLFEGTSQENTADAARKLRLVHKLTPEQARCARQAVPGMYRKLAREFGVSATAISKIARGDNWKYLDEIIK